MTPLSETCRCWSDCYCGVRDTYWDHRDSPFVPAEAGGDRVGVVEQPAHPPAPAPTHTYGGTLHV